MFVLLICVYLLVKLSKFVPNLKTQQTWKFLTVISWWIYALCLMGFHESLEK